jgi:hypothetical protein
MRKVHATEGRCEADAGRGLALLAS